MKFKLRVIVQEFYPPDIGDGRDIFERTVSAQALPIIGHTIPIGDMKAVIVSIEHPLRKGVLVHEIFAEISVRKTRGVYFDLWREMNQWESQILIPRMQQEGFTLISSYGLEGE